MFPPRPSRSFSAEIRLTEGLVDKNVAGTLPPVFVSVASKGVISNEFDRVHEFWLAGHTPADPRALLRLVSPKAEAVI